MQKSPRLSAGEEARIVYDVTERTNPNIDIRAHPLEEDTTKLHKKKYRIKEGVLCIHLKEQTDEVEY